MKPLPLALVVAILGGTAAHADLSPDVMASLTNGHAAAMQEIQRNVQPAANEGNRVAQAIVHEARIALGHDDQLDNFRVSDQRGDTLKAETEEAWITVAQKKANEGDPFFMDVMGYMTWSGYAALKDRDKAIQWWKKGAEARGGMAMLRLANCYLNGGLPLDRGKASQYYGEAGAMGIPLALYNMGSLCNDDGAEMQRDVQKAMEWWNKAAEMGHVNSQYTVGFFLVSGDEGVPINRELGAKWMRMAAAKGHPEASRYVREFLDKKPEKRNLPEAIAMEGTKVGSSFIAFDRIKEHLAGPKVSVVCFVDSYHPRPFTGRSEAGSTPSDMLDYYLSELRTLGGEGGDGAAKPEDVKIFIVECIGETRAKIQEFDKQVGFTAYDRTIPAIYVFASGRAKPVTAFTYETGAGTYGDSLKRQVVGLLGEPKASEQAPSSGGHTAAPEE